MNKLITLSLEKSFTHSGISLTIRERDFGSVILCLTVTEDGQPVDMMDKTMRFEAKKPDGTKVIVSVEDATAFMLPEQLFAVKGKIDLAYFVICEGDTTTSTQAFTINVLEAVEGMSSKDVVPYITYNDLATTTKAGLVRLSKDKTIYIGKDGAIHARGDGTGSGGVTVVSSESLDVDIDEDGVAIELKSSTVADIVKGAEARPLAEEATQAALRAQTTADTAITKANAAQARSDAAYTLADGAVTPERLADKLGGYAQSGVVYFPELTLGGPMQGMTINLQDILDIEEDGTRKYIGDGSDYVPVTGDYSVIRSGTKAARSLVYTAQGIRHDIIKNGVILLHDDTDDTAYTIKDKWVLRDITTSGAATPTPNSWYTTYDTMQYWLDEFGFWYDMREVYPTIARTIGYKTSFKDLYESEQTDLYLDTNFSRIVMPDGAELETYRSSVNPYIRWQDLICDPRYVPGVNIHIAFGSEITTDMLIDIDNVTIEAYGNADMTDVEAGKLLVQGVGGVHIANIRFNSQVNLSDIAGTVTFDGCDIKNYFNATMASSDGFVSAYQTTFHEDLTLTATTTGGDKAYFYFNTCWGASGSGFEGRSCPSVNLNSANAVLQMVGCTQMRPWRRQGDMELTDCTLVGGYDGITKLPGVISDNVVGKIDLVRCRVITPDNKKAPIDIQGTGTVNISLSEFDWAGSTIAGVWNDNGISSVQVYDRRVPTNYTPRLTNGQGSERTEAVTTKDHLVGIDDKLGELASGVRGAGVIRFSANNWISGTAYVGGGPGAGTPVNYMGTRGYWCNTANSDTTFDVSKWTVDPDWVRNGDTLRAWTDFITINGYALFPDKQVAMTTAIYNTVKSAITWPATNQPGAMPSATDQAILASLGWSILPNSPGAGTYLVLWFSSNQAWIDTATLSQYTASNGLKKVGNDFQVDLASTSELKGALESFVVKVAGKSLSTEDFTTALKDKLSALDNQAQMTDKFNAKTTESLAVSDVANDVTALGAQTMGVTAWVKAIIKRINGLLSSVNALTAADGNNVKTSGNQTVAGAKTFSSDVVVPNTAFASKANLAALSKQDMVAANLPVTITDIVVSTAGVVTVTMSKQPSSISIKNMAGTAVAGTWGAAGATMTFTPTVVGTTTSSAFVLKVA